MQQRILEAMDNLQDVPQSVEALMFSIYNIAVTSMTTSECETAFGEERLTLLAKYRTATQQALVKADFTSSQDLTVIQAFVLLLVGGASQFSHFFHLRKGMIWDTAFTCATLLFFFNAVMWKTRTKSIKDSSDSV